MMVVENPIVTIITTVRNGAATIERTIQSVLYQTYGNIQYIVIDANSNDGTIEIIGKYEDKIDYWVSESDSGIYDGFNKGIARAVGMYVGILNADDYLAPNAIQQMVSYIPTDLSEDLLPIIHGNINLITASGAQISKYSPESRSIENRFAAMPVNHPSTFVPLSVYKRVGLFNTAFVIAGDYDFILRAINREVKFIHVNKMWITMQVGGASSLKNAYTLSFERFTTRNKNGGALIPAFLRLMTDLTVFSARKFKRIFIPSKFENS